MHVNAMSPNFSKRPAHRPCSTRRPSDAAARHDMRGRPESTVIFPGCDEARAFYRLLIATVQHWTPRIGDAYLEDSLPDIALAAW